MDLAQVTFSSLWSHIHQRILLYNKLVIAWAITKLYHKDDHHLNNDLLFKWTTIIAAWCFLYLPLSPNHLQKKIIS